MQYDSTFDRFPSQHRSSFLHRWSLLVAVVLIFCSQAACRERQSTDEQQPGQSSSAMATDRSTAPSSEPPLILEIHLVDAHQPVLAGDAAAIAMAARGDLAGLLLDPQPVPAGTPLDERLAALEEAGALTQLAEYRVLTRCGQSSVAQAGYQLPIQANANGTITSQYINATMRVSLTAQCTAGEVRGVDVDVQRQQPRFDLTEALAGSTPISTVDQQARLVLHNGGTAVLSGMNTDLQAETGQASPELILLVTATRVEL